MYIYTCKCIRVAFRHTCEYRNTFIDNMQHTHAFKYMFLTYMCMYVNICTCLNLHTPKYVYIHMYTIYFMHPY